MNDTDEDKDLTRLGSELRRAENDLPPEIVDRLRAARREAVTLADEHAQQPWRSWLTWQRWGAAAAMAGVVLAVALVLQRPDVTLPVAEEEELAAAQDTELLEDLEFVAWMVALEDEDLPTSG